MFLEIRKIKKKMMIIYYLIIKIKMLSFPRLDFIMKTKLIIYLVEKIIIFLKDIFPK